LTPKVNLLCSWNFFDFIQKHCLYLISKCYTPFKKNLLLKGDHIPRHRHWGLCSLDFNSTVKVLASKWGTFKVFFPFGHGSNVFGKRH
jgi:hypothetical protein